MSATSDIVIATTAVDGNLMHHYGPRVVDGLELLARLIHPEAFTT